MGNAQSPQNSENPYDYRTHVQQRDLQNDLKRTEYMKKILFHQKGSQLPVLANKNAEYAPKIVV